MIDFINNVKEVLARYSDDEVNDFIENFNHDVKTQLRDELLSLTLDEKLSN